MVLLSWCQALFLEKAESLTHGDNGAGVVQPDPLALQSMPTLPHDLRKRCVKRIREHDVPHHPALEERERTNALCAIDDLIRHDKIPGFDFLAQAAHGGEGNDGAHAEFAEGGDIGARGDFVGGEFVVETVAGEEGDWNGQAGGGGGVLEDGDGRRRFPPGGGGIDCGYGGEAGEGLEASAADYGDVDRFFVISVEAQLDFFVLRHEKT